MTSPRRRTYSGERVVSYGSVGATQAADVLIFPPAGFTAAQQEFRLGSGQERFETASAALMTWGVPQGAHLELISIDEAQSEGYSGLLFNEFGAPIAPTADALEQLFASDGTPYLSAGTTVELGKMWSPSPLVTSHRVIYVQREERRIGYALGTLDSAPVIGEEYFSVEWREDDSVWAVMRSVTAVAEGRKYRFLAPLIRFRQLLQRRQYVRSLLPARTA
ncbi:uncharacterized protein (UPF0548 family) [Aurantimicrobium minutum]|uniref:DUF1990 family protein n=1 Tax=Aurantimicrobium minutum TaxID=708131 RepID=UPI0024751D21|nr:DUF1990 family protein [Aurantimicrobium minutum]MDH6532887.1 uncharacterized protein (UPF0548 family) [Aurantimicrobium minutum]